MITVKTYWHLDSLLLSPLSEADRGDGEHRDAGSVLLKIRKAVALEEYHPVIANLPHLQAGECKVMIECGRAGTWYGRAAFGACAMKPPTGNVSYTMLSAQMKIADAQPHLSALVQMLLQHVDLGNGSLLITADVYDEKKAPAQPGLFDDSHGVSEDWPAEASVAPTDDAERARLLGSHRLVSIPVGGHPAIAMAACAAVGLIMPSGYLIEGYEDECRPAEGGGVGEQMEAAWLARFNTKPQDVLPNLHASGLILAVLERVRIEQPEEGDDVTTEQMAVAAECEKGALDTAKALRKLREDVAARKAEVADMVAGQAEVEAPTFPSGVDDAPAASNEEGKEEAQAAEHADGEVAEGVTP